MEVAVTKIVRATPASIRRVGASNIVKARTSTPSKGKIHQTISRVKTSPIKRIN